LANQKKVQTSYDSGGSNTAKRMAAGAKNTGDWGNDTPQKGYDDGQDSLLSIVMQDFKAARDYVKDNYLDDWADYWKCYNLIRTRRGYEGIADDFVPESFTIIESVKSNIAGGKPKFTFVPMREEQRQDTLVINQMMDLFWEQNHMTQKSLNWVQDMLLYGNGILHASWEGDMPHITNIPLADFFVDPTATHMNNPEEPGYPRYAGHRYLTNRDDLKKASILNPDTGEMEQMYQNLDDIDDYDGDWDKLDKETKESFIGSTLGTDAIKHQVECIVYYTKKKKVVIANRKTVIYQDRNPYQKAKSTVEVNVNLEGRQMKQKKEVPAIKSFLPYASLRNYVDTSLFYAKGDMAIIIDQQEALNDISSQKRDNISFVLNNMWQIDPQFSHLMDQVQSVPGLVLPIPKGALQPLEKQMVTTEADAEMARIQDEMRRATAADEVIQGANSNSSRTTATEITATVNQANQRFATKLNTLENEGYAQLASIMFKMAQIFITQETAIRIIGPDGVAWKDYDPAEFTGEYEPKVSLESTQKTAKAEEGQKYLQVHQVFANSPYMNQKEFTRVYLEKVLDLPDERIKELLNVPPPPDEPPIPAPTVSMSLKLMPDQQAQVLSKFGIQSSQSDLMLGAGVDPMAIADNMQTTRGAPAVPSDAQRGGVDLPPGMTANGGTPESPPSGDTGDGPAGPTPAVAQ
jgi:hypothetical protein